MGKTSLKSSRIAKGIINLNNNMVRGNMENLTAESIDGYVKGSGNVIVLFYADWCPFCRAFLKTINQNMGKLKNRLVGAKVNEDDNPLWDRFGVEVVPTLVGFKEGRAVARKDGVAGVGLGEIDLLDLDRRLA